MDFTFSETQNDAAALAAMVFKNECTPERLKAAVGPDGRFDADLWARLGDAGLLGLCLPESLAGSGLGLLELCSVLVEAGRHVAPVPLATHLPTAMAIARFGDPAAKGMWLEGASSGHAILTSAVAEEREYVPAHPTTQADFDGDPGRAVRRTGADRGRRHRLPRPPGRPGRHGDPPTDQRR